MANALTILSDDQIRAKVEYVAVALTATDATLALVPAITGFIPVIVEIDLGFTGTYTVEFDDGTTSMGGPLDWDDTEKYTRKLGEVFIKGSTGAAINGDFQRTAGDCAGRIGFVYLADDKNY